MENVANPKQQLFTELFRPKTLDQAVIVPRIREELSKGLVDNILLTGAPGSGKSTLTRILAADCDDPLYINASLERGIDTIREKIITYASGLDAAVVVWIVASARDEHASAIEWLNKHTDDEISFFLRSECTAALH